VADVGVRAVKVSVEVSSCPHLRARMCGHVLPLSPSLVPRARQSPPCADVNAKTQLLVHRDGLRRGGPGDGHARWRRAGVYVPRPRPNASTRIRHVRARTHARAHTHTHTHTHTYTHITHHTLRAHAHAQARKHVALAQLPAQGRSFLRPLVLLPPARTGKFTEHTFCGGCLAQVEVKAGGMYTFPRGMSCTWEVR
jgi:hypothetical protein